MMGLFHGAVYDIFSAMIKNDTFTSKTVQDTLQPLLAVWVPTSLGKCGAGSEYLPRCKLCGIQVSWKVRSTRAHKGTMTCR